MQIPFDEKMKLFFEATKIPVCCFEGGQPVLKYTHKLQDFGLPLYLTWQLPKKLPGVFYACTDEFMYCAGTCLDEQRMLLIGPVLLYDCSISQAKEILKNVGYSTTDHEKLIAYFRETGTRKVQHLLSALKLLCLLLDLPCDEPVPLISCTGHEIQIFEDPMMYVEDAEDVQAVENRFAGLIRVGDTAGLERFLGDYLNAPDVENGMDIETQRMYILNANSFGSRLAIEAGVDYSVTAALSTNYMKKIHAAANQTDLGLLFIQCMRDYTNLIAKRKSAPLDSPLAGYVQQYIIGHYSEKISPTVIAEHLHMNVSYLCAQFKKETGMTVSTYVQQEKIEKAKQYLNEKNSIADISMALGFSSESYFCAVFKKVTGKTPAEWRKR